MKRITPLEIKHVAKFVYDTLVPRHGVVGTKKILAELNRLCKAETKRRNSTKKPN